MTLPSRNLQGKEGKLKTTLDAASDAASPSEISSSLSSWSWPNINGLLPSFISSSTTVTSLGAAGEGSGSTNASRKDGTPTTDHEGEKTMKSASWAIMSLLGKLVPWNGSLGAKSSSGSGEEVDASAREKKEGTEEKFELARFYRAVILK